MGSHLLLKFLPPKPHFLLGEGEEKLAPEIDPFVFELFYELLPVTVGLTRPPSFVPVPWSLLSYREQHFPPGTEAKRTIRYPTPIRRLSRLEAAS